MNKPQLSFTGRNGSMLMYTKGDPIIDITRTYFDDPIWTMKSGDPVPDMPLDVQIEPINRCNMSCIHCPIHHNSRLESQLGWDTFKKLADEAAHEGVCYFTICGIGEPTLNPYVFTFLKYVRELKVKPKGLRSLSMIPTVLITNGMWSKKQLEKCVKSPPDLISISIAGFDDESIVDRRKGIKLPKFKKNLGYLHKNRILRRDSDGGLSPVIHISTHVHPREMLDEEKKSAFLNEYLEMADVIVIKPTMLDQHYTDYEAFSGDTYLEYSNISQNHFERTAPCFETSRRLSLNSDGDVWCGHHNSEEFGQYLGNVKQQSIREIWHGKAINEFRRRVRAGVFHRKCCKTCGGEIRDGHRKASKQIEVEIPFK